MNNHYKRMFVLSEDEYNRLKMQQKVPIVSVAAATVEEPVAVTNVQTTPSPPPSARYNCTICGKIYKQKGDLRRHVKIAHGISPPTTAIIPPTPSVKATIIKKKKKKKNHKAGRIEVFDKVKKWMTILG